MRTVLLLFIPFASSFLHCPNCINVHGVVDCSNGGLTCTPQEFCKIKEGRNHIPTGSCHSLDQMTHKCHNGMCQNSADCYCCTTTDCVKKTMTKFGFNVQAPQIVSKPPCPDDLHEDLCHTISDVCTDKLAPVTCPRFCGLCDPSKKAQQIVTKPPCPDDLHEEMCSNISDVCTDRFAPVFCPRFCGLCDPTKMASQLVTKPPCPDYLHEDLCHTIPGVCTDKLAPITCPRFCGLCDPAKTVDQTTVRSLRKTTTTPTLPPPTTTTTLTPTTTTTRSTTKPTQQLIITAIVTAAATPRTTTAHSSGVKHHECYQCGDIGSTTYCSGLELVLPPLKPCPASMPYCITDIFVVGDGTYETIRRCGNRSRCVKDYWEGTSDRSTCVDADPTTLFVKQTCTYCCITDGCNKDKVPKKETFFKP